MEYAEAVEWLTKAAKNGMEPAFQLLMKLNSQNQ
jgi:TPR repeat protein